MKATGIVRRVDDLGRVVIPKELRRTMKIAEGTPMKMFVSQDGILIKKYYPESELSELAGNLMVAAEGLQVELGDEKFREIKLHIQEIQMLLKQQD